MVLVGAESVMNGPLAVSLNGLYCKTRVRGSTRLRSNAINLMKKQTMTRYALGEHRSINLQHGSIDATDASSESVSIYAGTDAINDAVAAFLPYCPRSTQERFMQILTDHIRKVDSIEA